MLTKGWKRIAPTVLLVLVIIGSGVFTGCGRKTVLPPVFSAVDDQILKSAFAEYVNLTTSSSPDAARATLVNNLNSRDGVANAHLGVDGTTIFIKYKDGDQAAVDTFEVSASEIGYSPTGSFSNISDSNDYGIDVTNVSQNYLEYVSFKNDNTSDLRQIRSLTPIPSWESVSTSAGKKDIGPTTTTTVTPTTTTTSSDDKGLIIQPAPTTSGPSATTTTSTPVTTTATKKISIPSTKVLILSPISDLESPIQCRDLFLQSGWNPADITLKMTTYRSTTASTTTSPGDKSLIIQPAPTAIDSPTTTITSVPTATTSTTTINPGALLVKPEDFFNLSGYGVIIINAHGCADHDFTEYNMYLQVGTVTKEAFDSNNGNNDYRRWKNAGQLVIVSCPHTATSDNAYQVVIRGDLLRERMPHLSSSYVEMSTCWGANFSSIFIAKGATRFISWNNSVYGHISDYDQAKMIQLTLGGLSIDEAYQDSSIIKQYTYSNGIFNYNKSLNVIATPPLVSYIFSPSPASAGTSIYLPAWIHLKVTGLSQLTNIKKGTSYIRVSIVEENSDSGVGAPYNLNPGQAQADFIFDKPDAWGYLAHPGKYKITIVGQNTQYDVSMSPYLAYGVATVQLNPGINNVQVQVVNQAWTDEEIAGPDGWVPGVSDGTTTSTTTTVTPTTQTSTPITITTPPSNVPTTSNTTVSTIQTSSSLTQINVWLTATKDPTASPITTLTADSVSDIYIYTQSGKDQTGDFTVWATFFDGKHLQCGQTFHAEPGKVIYCGTLNGAFLNTPGTNKVDAFTGEKAIGSTTLIITNNSTTVTKPASQLSLSKPETSGLKVTINGVVKPGASNVSINKIGWDWGDGTSNEQWFPATHTYTTSGQYTVNATAYQSDGLTTTKSVTVTVQP